MIKIIFSILLSCLLISCSSEGGDVNYKRGVFLLLDTSGTYTEELEKVQLIVNRLLVNLEADDTFFVARIDSDSFSEKDIVAKITLDSRPSVANRQKREFADTINKFISTVKSSEYTDISGGLLQAIDFLNKAEVGSKYIYIFSDLKEDLPKEFKRDFPLPLDGFSVKALNVTKLRSDNVDPTEYLKRVASWQNRVEQGGGVWKVINDFERSDALVL